MSSQSHQSKLESVLQKHITVPVQMTDLSTFDDSFADMKERFDAEMKRVNEQMAKFSKDLMWLYGQTTTVQTGMTSEQRENFVSNWETITNSPLVEGEGENKTLKLQFDVSQFSPSEITVKIKNDVLIVAARHEEKSDTTSVFREYNREFLLPVGTDPESIVSTLSREGVLTVQTKLPELAVESAPELPQSP